MPSGKTLTWLVFLLIAVIGLVFLTDLILSNGTVPSLDRFTATTTPQDDSMSTSQETTTQTFSMSTVLSSTTQTILAVTPHTSPYMLPLITVKAPRGMIDAEVATTSAAQQQGLGDRASLPENRGMLFVFQSLGEYGFWMKDMEFPLDMVWIDQNKTVVGVTANISTSTYPNVLFPPSDILYVLEVNAGAAQKFGLQNGAMVIFNLATST